MHVQMTYRGLTQPRMSNIEHLIMSLEQRLAYMSREPAFQDCGHGWKPMPCQVVEFSL